jgi:hypothetical protein
LPSENVDKGDLTENREVVDDTDDLSDTKLGLRSTLLWGSVG